MAVPQEFRTYWNGLAGAYSLLDSPLRPSRQDIRTIEQAIAGWRADHSNAPLKTLLLGVTPDIANMEWPEGSCLYGVDSSPAMVESVWPGDVPGHRSAVCGDWKALPLGASAVNVVIGDGSLSCVRHPQDVRAVVTELSRVLTVEGILILRGYIQPAKRESPDDVIADMLRGAIPGFHAFKLRFLISMQRSVEEGVRVDHVYRYWSSLKLDTADLSKCTGWPAALIRSMDLYRGASTVHVFPTLLQLRTLLASSFDEISLFTPSYPMGECCPVLIATPRRNSRSREARCTP